MFVERVDHLLGGVDEGFERGREVGLAIGEQGVASVMERGVELLTGVGGDGLCGVLWLVAWCRLASGEEAIKVGAEDPDAAYADATVGAQASFQFGV